MNIELHSRFVFRIINFIYFQICAMRSPCSTKTETVTFNEFYLSRDVWCVRRVRQRWKRLDIIHLIFFYSRDARCVRPVRQRWKRLHIINVIFFFQRCAMRSPSSTKMETVTYNQCYLFSRDARCVRPVRQGRGRFHYDRRVVYCYAYTATVRHWGRDTRND